MNPFSAVWSWLRGNKAPANNTQPWAPPVVAIPPAWPPADTLSVLAATLWMEARGDGKRGMQAVANVICHRAQFVSWWGKNIRGVCLAPYQFSSWNEDSTQIALVQVAMKNGDPQWAQALAIATQGIAGALPDITMLADSYYEPLPNEKPPVWAVPSKFTVKVGTQLFYRVQI